MRLFATAGTTLAIALFCTALPAGGQPTAAEINQTNTAAVKNSLPATKLNNGLADTADNGKRKSIFDDPLAGVVVNRTITVLGQDFYRYFTAQWRQKDLDNRYTISIYERPSARFGSEIWVQFRQKRMFHIFLPPARAATKKISGMAVEMVYQNIADSEVERLTIKSPDLGPEEM